MTFYRDYGISFILSKLLEKLGHECHIVSTENYLSKDTILSNPDAIFFMTANRAKNIIKHYPNAKLFFCSAEGHQELKLDEEYFIKNHELSENFINFFFWGKNSLDRFKKILKKTNISNDLKNKFLKKCLIVGHPRLDTIKFSQKKKKTNKMQIGFIGSAHFLSRIDNLSLSTDIINRELSNLKYRTEQMLYSANQLTTYTKIIKRLGFEKYSFSYRPYPQESREAIKATTIYKEKKLSLSNELDFGTWMSKNDLIIGDVTDTFTYMYTAKKPYISISKILGRPALEDIGWIEPTILKIKRNLYPIMPKNIDSLIKKIESKNIRTKYSSRLQNHLNNVFSVNKGSVLKKVSLSIDQGLKSKKKNFGIPFSLIKIFRNILPLNYSNSYSKISMNEKSVNKELKNVIDNLTKNHHL